MSDLDDLAKAARLKTPTNPKPVDYATVPPVIRHGPATPFRDAFKANLGQGLARLLVIAAVMFLLLGGICLLGSLLPKHTPTQQPTKTVPPGYPPAFGK